MVQGQYIAAGHTWIPARICLAQLPVPASKGGGCLTLAGEPDICL